MIDIHSHLLFDIDEGAKTLQDSLEIARVLADNGFNRVVGTPHVLSGVYNNTPEQITIRVQEVNQALEREKIPVKILCGAEYYIDFVFYKSLSTPGAILTINNTGKYVLVELPMIDIPNVIDNIIFQIKVHGLTPVLAHPERNAAIISKPQRAGEMKQKGFLLQVNLGSFYGIYGVEAKKTAEILIDNGAAYCVALDIHSVEQAKSCVEKGLPALKKIAGDNGVDLLLNKNPGNLISG